MMRFLVIVAAWLPAFGAADENTREVVVARHAAWPAKATVDTFDDRDIVWSAFHRQGRDGGFAVTCREGDVLSFDAYAGNMFVNSIGSVLKKNEPVRVRVKVDDYPSWERTACIRTPPSPTSTT